MSDEFREYSLNQYLLPFDSMLEILPSPAPAHLGSMVNALDFPMSIRTPICASLDGIVQSVKQNFNRGGPSENFRNDCNLIRIMHNHGEFTEYVHLQFKSSLVKPGEYVRAGDIIGFSGETGFTTYPHLHFGVFKIINKMKERVYLIAKFKLDNRIFTFEDGKKIQLITSPLIS